MDLSGKVAIVAGGSMGIGRAVAMLLAQKGANVVVADLNEEGGLETLKGIRSNGGDGMFIQVDVTDWEDITQLVSQTLKLFRKIDILFSSVGVYARARLIDTDEILWDRIMQINVKSAFLLCKAVIPEMVRNQGGSIILSSSSVGWHDSAPNIAAYATSKFAITGLTKSVACEHLTDHIRANCICPGPTDTPMIRGGRSPEELEAFVGSIPIKRLAAPEEIAQAVLFLASDESAYITGVAFPVDGGQTAFV
ncbi:MAG: glucose 1-dehydrogenase [Anaerolineales bacterium]|nr:glucose 1-dehydrogenase [Anaerolineales bacterium]